MKYLLICIILAFSMQVLAYEIPSYGSKRYIKAEVRANKHPKGSGIGTTKYNIKYTRDYNVNKYSRTTDGFSPWPSKP